MSFVANRRPSLDDKYAIDSGRVFLTGTQALARLPMIQRARDLAAGHNTAGFISGYRGSPLGGLDQALWKARSHLEAHHVRFRPGVNEDLAAAAVWGTQQVNLYPGAKYDGVFAMWYGKGPGVDRCGDVFRHANAAGTSPLGGVLVVAGDDHAARSSTLPHQTEHVFKALMLPVLAPSGVQEYLDYGVHGWALSRYSGCWVAFKAVADTVESSASVDVAIGRVRIVVPADYELPPGGLNIRWPDPPLAQEERLLHHKLYAALAYARANGLNRIVIDSPRPRLGIITGGKSYLDVRQALDDLGIDEALAAAIGMRVYKVGMPWPLEAEGVRQFAAGLEEILVVEEKRQVIEYQLKEELYNWREDVRPRVIGKFDEKGEWALLPGRSGLVSHGPWLLPAANELTPAMIARVIASRIARFHTSERIKARLDFLAAKERALAAPAIPVQRQPWFCPGCPHNTSTNVPDGSRAMAGIGCHYMAIWMDRNTSTFSHMGGEGAAWIGQAPFTETQHVFANLGDGTYFHSGILAIRAAIAARIAITYKILYNDAVAMTGGQPVDGELSVARIARQLAAEGVSRTVVVTDEPAKYGTATALPDGVSVHHRSEMDALQRMLRAFPGVTALIYDQTCAAEKRRRRKRGTLPDPPRRVFINERVCEGCGDCGVKSNCLAVVPIETEFGRKRAIDQSACNKDYSCLEGFCPSLVTIEDGSLRRGQSAEPTIFEAPPPPQPTLPSTAQPYGILVTGVGGTGVITIGAILGMAAHLDGKGVTVLDMTGLAQKGGAVYSHVRIADRPEDIHAVRVAAGEADAIIGADAVVSASDEAIAKMQAGITRAVVNLANTPTAEFTHNPDWSFPLERIEAAICEAIGREAARFVDATAMATRVLGDAIATNMFMLGYAWQTGLVPVSAQALDTAIELNAVQVDMNRRALMLGRRAAYDPGSIRAPIQPKDECRDTRAVPLDELIARRETDLVAYQDRAYARRYRSLVDTVRAADSALGGGELTVAVVRNFYKLMAYKDEYEVARLYSDPAFMAKLRETFAGNFKLSFHLAPPRAPRIGDSSRKKQFGPWMLTAMRILARFKGLRATRYDPFGQTPERRAERALIDEYESDLRRAISRLNRIDSAAVVELARLPEQIRGYGHVKARSMAAAAARRDELRFRLQLDTSA